MSPQRRLFFTIILEIKAIPKVFGELYIAVSYERCRYHRIKEDCPLDL